MTLHVVANLAAKPDKIEEAKALLTSLLAPTRKESGCYKYVLVQGTKNPAKFTFIEEWESQAALDAHLETDHIKAAFDKIPLYLEGDPEIGTFHLVG